MYYFNKKSSKKIIHLIECFHVHNNEIDNIGWFETLSEAYDRGYRLCKHCNPLYMHYKKESNEILEFCRKNGMAVNLKNKCISITSVRSKWKIALDKMNRIVLYHKNDFTTDKDYLSEINGYHLQRDVRRVTIMGYLNYIIEHDNFRMYNPLYIPKKKEPPKKGTKRYKKNQRKIKNYQRKMEIKNVLNLIESLNIPSA